MSERTPHILILSSWYPSEKQPHLGNFVERHAQLLAREYQVTVIQTEAKEGTNGIELKQTEQGNFTEIRAFFQPGGAFTNRWRRHKGFQHALQEAGTVDLVIGHVLLPHAWMFLEASKRTKKPLIWVEHGSYFRRDFLQRKWSPYETWMRRRVSAAAKEIVAVSEFLKKDMAAHLQNKKITIIGNHIDEQRFHPAEPSPSEVTRFLHVSTLDPKAKNPRGMLNAFKLVQDAGRNFQLTIVCDEDSKEWQQYASELGIIDRINFVGAVPWKEMPKYYHNTDAFVLFSDYETFSIVLAEALNTGTPIISTKVGIAAELPETCMMEVDKRVPESLSKALITFIDGERTFEREALLSEGKRYHAPIILERWKQLIAQHVQ